MIVHHFKLLNWRPICCPYYQLAILLSPYYSPLKINLYNHRQRMLNNALQRSTYSKDGKAYKYSVLPFFTSNKNSKLYHTPYKTSLTTMNTNNNTLSLYSNQSRYRGRSQQLSKSKPPIKNINNIQQKKTGSKNNNKNKNRKKQMKNSSKSKSVTRPPNKQSTVVPEKIITNRELYKGLRESLKSQSTSAILTKIGKIFDLILSNDRIPYQIQTFLYRPIEILRQKLKEKGKIQIGHTLTQFKNNCMHVVKESSASQIALFQRMQLPPNLRWSSKHNFSITKKQYQLQNRLSSFSNLKKKDYVISNKDGDALNRIQNCLDSFLCRSTKYRKVYF